MSPTSAPVTAETVAANAALVRERIRRAGGDPDAVTLVAVTKAFGPEVARAALDAGLADLGENYAQELLAKAADLGGDSGARFHFIGRLQRNKVRQLAPHVHLWQSVDRAELGAEIARRAPGAAVLVQVNATDEPQKGGCPLGEAAALADALVAAGLDVRGVMGVGRAGDADGTRRAFAALGSLADRLGLPVRSMGMTDDLELAVEAGTTMVRIGRFLFGERPIRAAELPRSGSEDIK